MTSRSAAWTQNGTPQIEEEGPPRPDGATGIHTKSERTGGDLDNPVSPTTQPVNRQGLCPSHRFGPEAALRAAYSDHPCGLRCLIAG